MARSHLARAGCVLAGLLIAVAVAPPGAPGAVSDPRVGEQWAVAPEAIINLPAAWDVSTGRGVVVAVVDSGARLEHPDLAPNVWTNFDEIPGNGVDDDGNGYVDDVHGIDLTSEKPSNDLSDNDGHGTHVSGIIAAAANGKGVVGVAYNAKIMTVRTVAADGTGTLRAVAAGVRYAAANGARVINISQSATDNDPDLRAAIEAAGADGALVVTSAGNEGRDDDTTPVYPAAFAEPNLLTVAATSPSQGRNLATFSNYGKTTVQLAAPGEDVLSTSWDGGWERKSGTSMAAPMVAGVAALVAAAKPGLSPAELRAQLLESAGRTSLRVGAGYVDALAAVRGAQSALQSPLGQAPDLSILGAEGVPGAGGTAVTLRVSVSGAINAIKRYRLTAGGRTVAYLRAPTSPWRVRFSLPGGAIGTTLTVSALSAGGNVITKGSAKVRAVPKRKDGVDGGPRAGTT